jgi:hypothetical protein
VVHAGGSGRFRSPLPQPTMSAMSFLLARPAEWFRIPQAASAHLETDYGQHTQIISGTGEVIGRVDDQSDGFTLAEVDLAGAMPKPNTPQPKMRTSGVVYFFSDVIGPALFRFVYQREMRRRSAE